MRVYRTLGVILCLVSLMFVGCGNDDDDIDALGVTEYLPIAEGNRWEFIDREDPEEVGTITITRQSVLEDGTAVWVVEVEDLDDREETGYLSKAGDDMIQLHQTLSDIEGELMYRSPLEVGASWKGLKTVFDGQKNSVSVSDRQTVVTPAGTFEDSFRVDILEFDGTPIYAVWLAKDVGPVRIAELSSDGEIDEEAVLQSSNLLE